ncbi:MAG TPA: TonB-dependent receptor [Candidatus Dormibacteraeota bacterium]|nr:TonB-dependent receptor [Candidatus Dormibacteraeota bacterium]
MRVFALVLFAQLLSVAALADLTEKAITVKVVDPQSAAVSGVQVQLLLANQSRVLASQITSPEGVATFHPTGPGPFQIKVLAPGFAAETVDASAASEQTIQLRLATAAETVVVSATRTPVPGEASGADVDVLNSAQFTIVQPTAAADAVRFLPGAIVNDAGQRGGLTSLFVRGGESRYNKVIVDGVTINEPGGTFDFGTLPLDQADRMEFVRGAQSTLYGSDAMTSLVQVWTRTGTTAVPDVRFGADGGNFSSAHGYASLAGARGRFDYNAFGSQFNTAGSGINTAYSDSLEGANIGAALNGHTSLRFRLRHSNSHTGVPGEWNFNGVPLEPPDPSDHSQLNTILGSAALAVAAPSGWQHRLTTFDYSYRYDELNLTGDPNRVSPIFGQFDFPSHEVDHINRVGFEYQGDYSERTWAHTTFGYRLENENGFVGDLNFGQTHGQRLNNDLYLQQQLTWKSLTAIAGARFIRNSAFGSTGVPRVALVWQALRSGAVFSGTRLRFSYATGFKEPRLEETFAGPPFSQTNTTLKPERSRSFEAGLQQSLLQGKFVFTATYFNNLFHDQINYVEVDPVNFIGEYVNVNKSLAHGAEIGLQAKLRSRLLLNSAYTYTSTQILDNPVPIDSQFNVGQPLLRRPRHSATEMLSYLGSRWGANLSGSFVGRRPDDDFIGFNIDHAAGYVRADLGGWYAVRSRITLYANIENALDRHYNEVVGYPALPINIRAGLRFRIGGE